MTVITSGGKRHAAAEAAGGESAASMLHRSPASSVDRAPATRRGGRSVLGGRASSRHQPACTGSRWHGRVRLLIRGFGVRVPAGAPPATTAVPCLYLPTLIRPILPIGSRSCRKLQRNSSSSSRRQRNWPWGLRRQAWQAVGPASSLEWTDLIGHNAGRQRSGQEGWCPSEGTHIDGLSNECSHFRRPVAG